MADQRDLSELGEVLRNLKEQVRRHAAPSGAGPITTPYDGAVSYCGFRYRFKARLEIDIADDPPLPLPNLWQTLEDLEARILTAAAPSGLGSLSMTHDMLVEHGGAPFRLKALFEIGSPNGTRPIFAPEDYELVLA